MKNQQVVPALTGLRAVAAYMVFFHHYNPFSKGSFLHQFTAQWHIGVTLFFVLSGFLITWRYYHLKPFRFKTYMINRFARIYPMYFILTTITFLYFIFRKITPIDFTVYLHNIFFTKGFFIDLKFSGIAQGWSLTVEEMFYLFAPLFFVFLRKSYRYLILLPLVFISLGILFMQLELKSGFLAEPELVFGYTFFGRCLEFFIGMALALLLFYQKRNFKIITSVAIVFIILGIVALTQLNNFWSQTFLNTLVIPLLGIAPLLYGLLTERNVVSRFLATRVMVLLGKSSYVFYLIHMGIFVIISNKISDTILFRFVFINCLAVVLYLFIEKPLNAFIRRAFSKPTESDF